MSKKLIDVELMTFSGMPHAYRLLFNYMVNKCNKHNITLFLYNKDNLLNEVGSDSETSGYFIDYPVPEIHVACGKAVYDWFPTLVHEFNHAIQFATGTAVWKQCYVNGVDVGVDIDQWVNKRLKLTTQQKNLRFQKLINVELDAEKRTVDLLRKFEIPMDLEEYIKNANSYIMFYHVLKTCRKWYKTGNEPYNNKEILDMMPSKFNLNYSIISDTMLHTYLKYYG